MSRHLTVALLLALLAPQAAFAQDTATDGPQSAAQAVDPNQIVDPDALFGQPLPPPDPNAPDTSQYNLFNPTPDDQLRPLSTDRPGKTHSAITVDPGHFQLESDFVNYTYDHYSPGATTTRSISVGTPILKEGLTNWADIELAFDLYSAVHTTQRGSSTTSSSVLGPTGSAGTSVTTAGGSGTTPGSTQVGKGFGDMLLGGKINIFGDDGGDQALALLPFVKIPTAASNVGNGEVEYTLNVPYEINLDSLWSLTLEPAFGWLKNTENASHHGDYTALVNVNRPVFFKTVTASFELAAEYADHDVPPRYTADPAIQWLVTPNLQLDMGAYIGLNKAAPDYNPYIGVSFRY